MPNIDKWLEFYNSPKNKIKAKAREILLQNYSEEISIDFLVSIINDFPFFQYTKVPYTKFKNIVVQRYCDEIFFVLQSFLDISENSSKIEFAADVFAVVKDKRVVNSLLDIVEKEDPDKNSLPAGWRCIWALARIADKSSKERLIQIYKKRKDDNINIVMALESALKSVGVDFKSI